MKQNAQKNLKTNSVEEVLADLGVVVVNAGREISCQCPFHPDRHPSFSINSDSGLWICYQCGRSGTLTQLAQQVAGKSVDLRELKRSRFHPPKKPPAEVVREAEAKNEEPRDPYYLYAKYMSFKDVPGWALAEKYISREAAQQYGIRWSKGWIIPIWSPRKLQDITEDFWGWQGKREHEVSNYPPEIKKSQTLFGLSQVRSRTAILVESPLDVVRMASVGIHNAVASYGAMVSAYQMGLLEAKFDRLILALDDDEAGMEQSAKIYPLLYRKMPVTIQVFHEGVKDPGDMTDEQLLETFGATEDR